MPNKLIIASPHGFCAGVERAINILEKSLEKFGAPIYVNHQIVHNEFVVKYFEDKGVIFEADLEKIPKNSIMIFSAHGIPPQYREKCEKKGLRIIDASCPLVLKVHMQVKNFSNKGYKVLVIGQKNHQEMKGVSGVAKIQILENESDIKNLNEEDFKDDKVVCLTQTTLSMDYTKNMIRAVKNKIKHLEVATGICYASQNRQNAVKELAKQCDFVLVIGSRNSSNSNKLVDTAKKLNCKAILIDDPEKIPTEVSSYKNLGLTSGASVPEELFMKIVEKLKSKDKNLLVEKLEVAKEDIKFPLNNKLL